MFLYLIKGEKSLWLFEALDNNKAKTAALLILSFESIFLKINGSLKTNRMDFYYPQGGHCLATPKTLEELKKIIKKNPVRIIFLKEGRDN